jgi:hypothetical protein
MRRRQIIAALVLSLFASEAFAVGTVTVTVTRPESGVVKYSVAWTSTSGGAVSGNAFAVSGQLFQVEVIPGSGGSQPTDLYDATMVNPRSVDFLIASGSNLSNSTGKVVQITPALYLDTTLDLVIAAAGDTKSGTFVLWVRVQ